MIGLLILAAASVLLGWTAHEWWNERSDSDK